MKRGSYYGTEVNGQWWRRYRGPAFFARGNGEFYMDAAGIEFRKTLTNRPLQIGWDEVTSIQLGAWHAGRWGGRKPILKVGFHRDGECLAAGFGLRVDQATLQQLVADLRRKTNT